MKPNPENLFDWTEPEKVERSATRSLRIRGLTLVPFILLFTFLILFEEDIYHLIDPDLDDAPGQNWSLFPVLYLYIIYISLFKLFPKTIRLFRLNLSLIRPKRFQIDQKYITSSLRLLGPLAAWRIRTAKLTGYSLLQHDVFSEVRVVTVHSGKHRKDSLILPDDHTAKSIIDFFASNFPELKTSETILEAQLSKRQFIFLFMFIMIYALLVTSIFAVYPLWLGSLMLCSTVLLGPGTIGLLILLRKRFFRLCNASYWVYAFSLNISVPSLMLLFSYIYLLFTFR